MIPFPSMQVVEGKGMSSFHCFVEVYNGKWLAEDANGAGTQWGRRCKKYLILDYSGGLLNFSFVTDRCIYLKEKTFHGAVRVRGGGEI